MRRPQLEHVIRAAAGITGATEIVVIGSQSLLGRFPDAPADFLASIEADVFTFRSPGDADLIEGSIGEGSPFHQTFGYYAHGVAQEIAVLPAGWKERSVSRRLTTVSTSQHRTVVTPPDRVPHAVLRGASRRVARSGRRTPSRDCSA